MTQVATTTSLTMFGRLTSTPRTASSVRTTLPCRAEQRGLAALTFTQRETHKASDSHRELAFCGALRSSYRAALGIDARSALEKTADGCVGTFDCSVDELRRDGARGYNASKPTVPIQRTWGRITISIQIWRAQGSVAFGRAMGWGGDGVLSKNSVQSWGCSKSKI